MKKNIFYAIMSLVIISLSIPSSTMAIEEMGVDIHGFISQGYLKSNEYNYLSNKSEDGSFEYNEMGINFGKNVSDKLRLGLQIFARDLGDVANNDITLDWAFADYRWKDFLGARVGKIKMPLGFYNETRDFDMLRTCILLPQGIYGDLSRDTTVALNGAGLYGHVVMGGAGSLDYQAMSGAVNPRLESGVEKYMNAQLWGNAYIDGEPDIDTVYAGSMKWNTPLSGLVLGSSFYKSQSELPVTWTRLPPGYPAIDTRLKSKTFLKFFSVEYTWNNLTLAGELLETDSDSEIVGISPPGNTKGQAYYVLASYRFTDWFELGSYYSEAYTNKDDKDGDEQVARGNPDHRGWDKDLALSLRFDLSDNCIFKLEGHKVNGTKLVVPQDNPNRSEEDWNYFAAKVSFRF